MPSSRSPPFRTSIRCGAADRRRTVLLRPARTRHRPRRLQPSGQGLPHPPLEAPDRSLRFRDADGCGNPLTDLGAAVGAAARSRRRSRAVAGGAHAGESWRGWRIYYRSMWWPGSYLSFFLRCRPIGSGAPICRSPDTPLVVIGRSGSKRWVAGPTGRR